MARSASGPGAMAATAHHDATGAALTVMADGGNAVDAAIAANAVLGVVAPETCGVGGDLFALVWRPGAGRPDCLNASGRAGSGADAASLRRRGLTAVPHRSPQAVTVPGCVDGWEALAGRHGSRPLAELLQPAVELCSGFEVSPELAGALARGRDWLEASPAAVPFYGDDGPVGRGATVARPGLGETLARLASGGRDAFFAHIGPGVVAATDGGIQQPDLDVAQADWVDPIGTVVADHQGWTVPPNSQGYLALASLAVAARRPSPSSDDDRYYHGIIEAYRSSAAERNAVVADPATAPLPAEQLLDGAELDRRAAAITEEARSWPIPARASGGTTYLCMIDDSGMGVSLIQSNFTGFGGGLAAGATGVFLHNRGAGFNLVGGHPNELAPGKRPLHTLSPTLWTSGGELAMLLGTRGGHQQPQILCQVGAHLLLGGDDPATAQQRPRWVIEDFAPLSPSAVRVEARMPSAVVTGLRRRGHHVDMTDEEWQEGWGPVSIIRVAAGRRTGAADPRVSTANVAAG